MAGFESNAFDISSIKTYLYPVPTEGTFDHLIIALPMNKQFKLKPQDIRELIQPMGGCVATDKITVHGEPIDYMVREEPLNDIDSGWQFFSGTETQEYIDDPANSMVYDVNTIANYDPAIIPYLNLPSGTQLERVRGTNRFNIVPG